MALRNYIVMDLIVTMRQKKIGGVVQWIVEL